MNDIHIVRNSGVCLSHLTQLNVTLAGERWHIGTIGLGYSNLSMNPYSSGSVESGSSQVDRPMSLCRGRVSTARVPKTPPPSSSAWSSSISSVSTLMTSPKFTNTFVMGLIRQRQIFLRNPEPISWFDRPGHAMPNTALAGHSSTQSRNSMYQY